MCVYAIPQEELAEQKGKFEAVVQRQLAFVDTLLKDKEGLTEQVETLLLHLSLIPLIPLITLIPRITRTTRAPLLLPVSGGDAGDQPARLGAAREQEPRGAKGHV